MNKITKHAIAMGMLVQAVSSMEPENKGTTENTLSLYDEMLLDGESFYDGLFNPLNLNDNFDVFYNLFPIPEASPSEIFPHNTPITKQPCLKRAFADEVSSNKVKEPENKKHKATKDVTEQGELEMMGLNLLNWDVINLILSRCPGSFNNMSTVCKGWNGSVF